MFTNIAGSPATRRRRTRAAEGPGAAAAAGGLASAAPTPAAPPLPSAPCAVPASHPARALPRSSTALKWCGDLHTCPVDCIPVSSPTDGPQSECFCLLCSSTAIGAMKQQRFMSWAEHHSPLF